MKHPRTHYSLVLAGMLVAATAVAQMPRTISYQGILTTPLGLPIGDGNQQVTIKLYEQETGGAAIYSETQTVSVVRGLFNVILGSSVSGGLPAAVHFDRQYWVGVTVGSDPEFSPRVQLTSSPYTFNAMYSDSARNLRANSIGASHLIDGSVTAGKLNTTGSVAGQVLMSNGTTAAWTGLPAIVVTSLNGMRGDLEILGGTNIQVTKNAATGKITVTSLGVGTINTIVNNDGALEVTNPNGPTVTLNVANQGIKTAMLADAAVTTTKLGAGSVTNPKLGQDAVTTDKIADGQVFMNDLADNSVSSSKIIDGAVHTVDIADSAVTSLKIKDGDVQTVDLANGAVVAAKLADGSVTSAKIADATIVDADVSSAAAISYSKLNLNNSIVSGDIVDGTITNADVSVTAGIAYNKLALTNSIQSGDLTSGSVTLPKVSSTGAVAGQAILFDGTNIVWGSPTPSGSAGGDLTGTYPNPTVAANAITTTKLADGSVTTPKIADGAVTDAKVANGISYSKLSGAPTSLPPSGAAGGDLTGTYPNPTIATGAVTSAKILDGTIVNADVSPTAAIAYSKLALTNSIVTADLTDGSVTTPKIADGAVTDAKVANGISYSKLSGAPTSLPPSGAAGGDLTGTYPNPTVAANAITSAKILDGTIVNADVSPTAAIAYSKLALTNSIVTADLTDGSVTDAKVANGISYSKLSGAPTSLPPSGAAGGDLTGTYPNPTVAANAITSAKIADGTIVNADVSPTAAIAYSKLALTNSIVTGDLTDGSVTDAKVANGISYSKLSGAPTSLPPSGAAGGDLTGTYPNPVVAANAITSAKIADGTITNADVSAAAAISYSKLNLTGSLQGSDIAAGTFTSTNSHRAIGNNDNVARELRMLEPSGSGVNYTAFKAQAQAGDITYTLPNTAPAAANQVLQVQTVAGNNATLSWGTIGGGAILFARTGVIANAGNTSYAVQPSDDIVGIDMSAGTNFTVNLTPATTTGEILVVKIERYNNALLPVLTLQPSGTDRIDGAVNLAFGSANGNRRLYSDGAGNWYTW